MLANLSKKFFLMAIVRDWVVGKDFITPQTGQAIMPHRGCKAGFEYLKNILFTKDIFI